MKPIIEKLIAHVESECSAIDQDRIYDEMLDECYSLESVGGPFACMSASRVLKEVDPIAYRCGKNDYFGIGGDYVEIGAELYETREVEKARESFVEDLESEASDLESEIEDLEAEDDPSLQLLASKKRELADKQADIKEAEAHTF